MEHSAVAIDGPTGAGKTTLAGLLAQDLGFTYVDTGALYRAVGLFVADRGIDSRDAPGIVACLPHIALDIVQGALGQRILLGGQDVTGRLRGEEASRYASDVSAVPQVRDFLLERQREMARGRSVVMEGRDIGTVVLPGARVKIFLTATSMARALRRHRQLLDAGEPADLHAVHQALLRRDANDSQRAAAPLRVAADSVIVDTTHLNLEQARRALLAIIKEKVHV